jgi:hypothetical protein
MGKKIKEIMLAEKPKFIEEVFKRLTTRKFRRYLFYVCCI